MRAEGEAYCPGRYDLDTKGGTCQGMEAGPGRQEGSDDLLIPASNQETPEGLGRPTFESARIEGRHIAGCFPVPALFLP